MEKLSAGYLVVAAAGISLAIYVTNEYLTQNFTSCNINPLFSCGGVYQSGDTSLFGIPFYMMGLVWFPAVFTLGLLTSQLGKKLVNSDVLLPVLMVGNIFTIYLWYLELAVIHVICPLCVSLYAVNYALTIIVLIPFLRESHISGGGSGPEAITDVDRSEN
jgi:uncharacterized membrane protein